MDSWEDTRGELVVVLRCNGRTHAVEAGALRFLLEAAFVRLEDRMADLRESPLDWEDLDGVIGEFERKMDAVLATNGLQQAGGEMLDWVKSLPRMVEGEGKRNET